MLGLCLQRQNCGEGEGEAKQSRAPPLLVWWLCQAVPCSPCSAVCREVSCSHTRASCSLMHEHPASLCFHIQSNLHLSARFTYTRVAEQPTREHKESLTSVLCSREDLGGQPSLPSTELQSWSRENEIGDLGEQSSEDTGRKGVAFELP